MCECSRTIEHRTASKVGFREPEAKGAMVRGTRPAARRRSKAQWYEPWAAEGSGTGAGSLTRKQVEY
jgi:hypothetical protein